VREGKKKADADLTRKRLPESQRFERLSDAMTFDYDCNMRDGACTPRQERLATDQEITDRDWAWFLWHPRVVCFSRALYRDEAIEEALADAPQDGLYLAMVTRVGIQILGDHIPGVMLRSQHYTDRKAWDAGVGRRRGELAVQHILARDGAIISTLSSGSRRWVLLEPAEGGAA
jgi:hypothetical protein